MNTDIRKLIDKYYSGKTSLEEEEWLRKSLSYEEIKHDENHIKQIFDAFEEEKTETTPMSAKTFSPLKDKSQRFTLYHKKWIYITSGIAACLLIVFGTFFYQYKQKNTAYVMIDGVRINDEKLAIEYVNNQFSEISSKIDKSLEPLRNVEKKEKEIKEKLNFITNIHY
jgi:hypothetical protein